MSRDVPVGGTLEAPFRDVVEASSNGMLLVGSDGVIAFVNPAAEELFGYARGELLGEPVETLVPDAVRAAHPELRHGYLAAPVPRPMGAGRDLFGRRKDGSEFAVEIGLTPMATSRGAMVLATITDITLRKMAEEQLASVAHTLQTALLPGQLPHIEAVQLANRYRPGAKGTEVGGDWFDAIVVEDRITLAIGDVAGRGVDAAAVMGAVRHAVATSALTSGDPGRVLTLANQYLRSLGPGMVTCLVVSFDLAHGTASIATAGHPPIVIVPPDGPPRLVNVPPGLPLGILNNYSYSAVGLEVRPGSTVVLYTDGLIERRTEPIQSGLDRMLDALADGPPDAEAFCDHLLAAFEDGIDDDVALLVARFAPAVGFSKEAPAAYRATVKGDVHDLPRVRDTLHDWLAAQSVSPWTRFAVVTAVNEAVANSILHAHTLAAEPIAVEVSARGGAATATVVDRGVWGTGREEPGRGLQLMRMLMDEVVITTTNDGSTVRLTTRSRE